MLALNESERNEAGNDCRKNGKKYPRERHFQIKMIKLKFQILTDTKRHVPLKKNNNKKKLLYRESDKTRKGTMMKDIRKGEGVKKEDFQCHTKSIHSYNDHKMGPISNTTQ